MGYEIPQELEYKEIIMYGLTLEQLFYALLFGIPSALIYFNTNWADFLKIPLIIMISSIGVAFMFFDARRRLSNIYWFLYCKITENGKLLMKKLIAFEKIENNLIITNDKKRIAIVKVDPINFSIKPNGEKETILESFKKFLNSLEFPVQVLINTHAIQLDDYFTQVNNNISESEKKTYDTLCKKYIEHLKDTVKTNGIMDRGFYVLIPEMQKDQIEVQMSVCEESLNNLNLKFTRLDDEKLKSLVSFFYNTKLKKEQEAIKSIENTPKNIKVNETYHRIIYASGYPRIVEPGFLDRIVSALGNFDLSIHILPYPIESMLIHLDRELQKQMADMYSETKNGKINPSLELKINDTRFILEQLQKGQDKLFYVSLYIDCKSDKAEDLDVLQKKVEATLSSLMIIPKIAKFRMVQGLQSIAPLCNDTIKERRNITSKALSAFFPFTSQFFKIDETGVWLGLNKNKIPIIRDIFKLPNPNGLVLAQSGGGKSYFCKLLIARYLLNGTRVMVVDPQGEYAKLVHYFHGQRIDLSRNSLTMINPLDLMGHDYIEKRLSLMDLMLVMLGELTEPQKAFIDRAITDAYQRKGITENPETWQKEPPILSDILEVLKMFEKRALQIEKSTIRSLMNRISMYVDGVFSFMNRQTNINFDNRFVCFDIGSMPKQVKPVIMFLVLDYVYMKMKSNIERKILLIDEAWSLLSRAEDATYIFEIVKTCRKYNLGLLLINQEVEGLLTSEAGKSVLANSAYQLLMRQKPAVIDAVCQTFHLSGSERTHLLTANVGEGILIMEDDHTEIKIVASEEEHKIITTNPDEMLKNAEQSKTEDVKIADECKTNNDTDVKNAENCKSESVKSQNIAKRISSVKTKMPTNEAKPKESIFVDAEDGFYRDCELSLNDKKYLLAKKYIEAEYFSIVSQKTEKFLLKPRHNESASHFFVVRDTANYLKGKVQNILINTTKNPDIAFTFNKKKFGIEVETGNLLKSSRKYVLKKVPELNKKFDEWFFVVTDKNIKKKYEKFAETIDRRYLIYKFAKILKQDQNKSVKNTDLSPHFIDDRPS